VHILTQAGVGYRLRSDPLGNPTLPTPAPPPE